MTWTEAPDVKKMARSRIASDYPELHKVDIVYVFRDKATSRNNKTVWGKLMIKRGLDAMLARQQPTSDGIEFFVMEIARDIWDDLSPAEREYLVDHELAHAHVETSNGVRHLSLVEHDIEEFGDVIKRHGLMTNSHSNFVTHIGKAQLELFASNL